MSAGVVALLGAESTGKTTLARQLARAFAAQGHRVALVGEYLREFCDASGRTPRIDEQAGIAAEQTRRIASASVGHDIVIADTTALMIAVYSDLVFGDRSLYAGAEAAHRSACRVTLLTALDLPWQPDGLQRDGPHVREPVDALVRAALARADVAYGVVHGEGDGRAAAALAAARRGLDDSPGTGIIGAAAVAADERSSPGAPRWTWHCERCGDPDCERHTLFPR